MMTGVGDYVHEERRWVLYPEEEKAEGRQSQPPGSEANLTGEHQLAFSISLDWAGASEFCWLASGECEVQVGVN